MGRFPFAFGTPITDATKLSQALQANFDKAATAGSLTDHITDATDAHAASAIKNTPAGSIAAVNVQTALNELDTEKIAAALVDAKGDLLVGTAADTVARKAVGANGSVLVADSASADGVTWQAPSEQSAFKAGGFIGRTTVTANISPGAQGAGTRAIMSVTHNLIVTGDGVNYIELELTGFAPYQSAGTVGHFSCEIYDGFNSVVVAAQQFYAPVGQTAGGLNVRALIAPHTQTRTYQYAVTNNGVTVNTFVNQAAATYPTILSARWAGSTGHA